MNKLDIVRQIKKISESEKYKCPLNGRSYKCSDFIYFSKSEKSLHDKDLDIAIVVGEKGLTISKNSSLVEELLKLIDCNTLKRLCTEVTKKYKFSWDIVEKDGTIQFLYPKKNEEWKDYVVFLSYLCQLFSFKSNSILRFYIVQEESTRQKQFSFFKNYGFSLLSFGYRYIGYPKIIGKISEKLNEITKKDAKNQRLLPRLLQYGHSLKDLYLVNLGSETFFVNPSNFDEHSIKGFIEKGADPDRCRTDLDWIVKSRMDGKYLIIYSDLDSYLAIAHELGHYEIDKEGLWGKLQQHSGITESILGDAVRFMFGFIGGVSMKPENSAKLEMAGSMLSMLSRSPLLTVEFMASYRGVKILERLGATKEELEIAKEFFRQAYFSYLASTVKQGTDVTLGRSVGRTMRVGGSLFKKKILRRT